MQMVTECDIKFNRIAISLLIYLFTFSKRSVLVGQRGQTKHYETLQFVHNRKVEIYCAKCKQTLDWASDSIEFN